MHDRPVILKGEDRPEAPDPHEAGVALMDLLRTANEGAEAIRTLIANWYRDPGRSQRRALEEAVDLVRTTADAVEAGESLMRARRTAGDFSSDFSEVRP